MSRGLILNERQADQMRAEAIQAENLRRANRVRWEVAPMGPRRWMINCHGTRMGTCKTQAVAIALATLLCRQRWADLHQRAELHIKGRNGRIRDSRTYGDDPLGDG